MYEDCIGNVLIESVGKVILDSTCMKIVSGEKWMNEYIENLIEDDKRKLFVVKQKVSHYLDLVMVWKVKL